MINVNDLKNGVVIEYDGKLMQILEFMHVLQNKVAYVRVKMKDLRTGTVTETALKGSDSAFKKCFIDKREMQYLYSDGGMFVFMDTETYDQIELSKDKIGDNANFLKEGLEVTIAMYEGEMLGITLPEKVEYEVIETQDATKGNTTNNAQKDATIETGYTIKVPLFINQGETIVVSTSDGKYAGRA